MTEPAARPHIVSPVKTRQKAKLLAQKEKVQDHPLREEEEKQESKDEQPDPDPPPSDHEDESVSEESIDSIDSYIDNMSTNQPKGILQKMLGKAFMEPVTSLNVTQGQSIRQTLSNVMSTIMDYRHDGGYSWLIEEEGNYKLRLGITDTNFTMPDLPPMPKYEETANREQIGHYNIKMTQYQSGRFWNSELLEVIQKKIPGAESWRGTLKEDL